MPATFNNARKCLRCGHEWIRKGDSEPKRCPKCRSEYWREAKPQAQPATTGGHVHALVDVLDMLRARDER